MTNKYLKEKSFAARILINAFVLWFAIWIYNPGYIDSLQGGFINKAFVFIIASLFFSLVNAIIRPILVFLSIPALLLTFGLFSIVINGLVVYFTLALTPGLAMPLGGAIITAILMSLINFLITKFLITKENK